MHHDADADLKQYTTIHKSKGLEATAVLVICETKNKLAKWLEGDGEARFNDKNDECRLGFVAFSRAREVLCIACLEELPEDSEIMEKIRTYMAILN